MTTSLKLLTLSLVLSCIFISSTNADCWNFISGSRCDNEDFWNAVGYKKCQDECKSKNFRLGKCVEADESCWFLTRGVKTCKCFK